jgi:RHS repeat-associated protein
MPTTNQECANAAKPGNPILDASREDGYFDGTLSLQGVRAYDPNLNQWTTPDAYSGDVHAPMSQHPYMWNDNNPVQFADPTGYDTYILVNNGSGGIRAGMGHTMVIVTDPKDPSHGTLFSWHPDTSVGNISDLAGHKGIMDTTSGSVSLLLSKSSSYDAFHANTSSIQDQAIKSSLQSSSDGNFNLADNNCNDVAAGACARALSTGSLTSSVTTWHAKRRRSGLVRKNRGILRAFCTRLNR